jgi:enoyl-CoA hydratase/carnithine racemase
MTDRVTWTVTDGVADVRLNRPEKLNALDAEMFVAIGEAGDAVAADPHVRAVVLSGEGRGFCSGLDFSMFTSFSSAGGDAEGAGSSDQTIRALLARPGGREDNGGQHTAWVWHRMAVPVIAAVHGVALGGGLQIALGADIRIVAPDARLSVLEIRWGLIPDMTGTWMLPRLVGPDVAKELTWTGRMVSGTDAVSLGLATRTSEHPRDDALALAADIAGRSPTAIRGAKALLSASLPPGAGGRTPAEHFADEERTMRSLVGSSDQLEAVAAALEQRPARFPDPPR